jgi:hypothetical protein
MTAPTPSPMQTPDIGGLLRRTPPAARPTPPPAPRTDVEVPPPAPAEAPPTAATPTPARTPRRRGTAPAAAATSIQKRVARGASGRQYLRSIAVYLPRSVHQQLKTEAAAGATTATALILAAVNATHGRVGDLLDEDRESTAGLAGGGTDLFEIPQARRVAEPTVQTTIRVTDAQLQAITELAATHDANRSQLITASLRLHLTAAP